MGTYLNHIVYDILISTRSIWSLCILTVGIFSYFHFVLIFIFGFEDGVRVLGSCKVGDRNTRCTSICDNRSYSMQCLFGERSTKKFTETIGEILSRNEIQLTHF